MRETVAEVGEDYIIRSFIASTLHQILWRWSSQWRWDGWGIQHACERWDVYRSLVRIL